MLLYCGLLFCEISEAKQGLTWSVLKIGGLQRASGAAVSVSVAQQGIYFPSTQSLTNTLAQHLEILTLLDVHLK